MAAPDEITAPSWAGVVDAGTTPPGRPRSCWKKPAIRARPSQYLLVGTGHEMRFCIARGLEGDLFRRIAPFAGGWSARCCSTQEPCRRQPYRGRSAVVLPADCAGSTGTSDGGNSMQRDTLPWTPHGYAPMFETRLQRNPKDTTAGRGGGNDEMLP